MTEQLTNTDTKLSNEDEKNGFYTLIAADGGSLPVRTDQEKQAIDSYTFMIPLCAAPTAAVIMSYHY